MSMTAPEPEPAPAPLTLDELVQHPALTNVVVCHEARKRGVAFVAERRGGPLSLAYELYGHGPIHLVFIMGLNGPMMAWHRQVKYFGVDRADRFSVLVFDNRGVGDSSAPWALKYSTSDMAKDTLELCDHVEWTAARQLHVVGVSMGGMIAQEMAYLAPERIASLTLQSTAAVLVASMPWHKHITQRAYLIMPKTLPARLEAQKRSLFSGRWLAAPDDQGEFPTNADRFAAEGLWRLRELRPPPVHGLLLQGLATTWHHMGPDRLRLLGSRIDRVLVCTGTADAMIEPSHSDVLVQGIAAGGCKVVKRLFPGVGHVLSWEAVAEYNSMLDEFVTHAHARSI